MRDSHAWPYVTRGVTLRDWFTLLSRVTLRDSTLPLEGVPLYLVIHRMQALKQGSDGGQPSPP